MATGPGTDSSAPCPGRGFTSPCSLRQVVLEAERLPGYDQIQLWPGTHVLESQIMGTDTPETGDLDITSQLRIVGAGAGLTTIDAGSRDRAIDITAGALAVIDGLTIVNGIAQPDGHPTTNHSHGGAIHNHGTLYLSNSSLVDNQVPTGSWGGGGLTNAPGATAQLRNVTIANNDAAAHGGGIENSGNLTVIYSTIASNWSLYGGGIAQKSGTVTLSGTILAHNSGGRNCWGQLGANVYATLSSDDSCVFPVHKDTPFDDYPNLSPVDPQFAAPWQEEGGHFYLYPLSWGSPAIDAGWDCTPLNVDEVGQYRPLDGNLDGVATCDLGAAEAAFLSLASDPPFIPYKP